MTLSRHVAHGILVLCGSLGALLVLEGGLRLEARFLPPPLPSHRSCGGCSYLYEPVPSRGDVNAAGFRGPEVRVDRPAVRIAVIGDSVAFGAYVHEDLTFPRLLERTLRESDDVEVINAAVRGHTPYTEARWFRDRVAPLRPDIVVVQTCMNDFVDPRPHWNATARVAMEVPTEAVPLGAESEAPRSRLVRVVEETGVLRSTEVMRRLGALALDLQARSIEEMTAREVKGKLVPAFVSGESFESLAPLLNEQSAEWTWAQRQYRVLLDAAEEAGAQVVFLVMPLAYELEPNYPLDPEAGFRNFCARMGVRCVDARREFESAVEERLFLGRTLASRAALPDVWHLTESGHQQTAAILARHLRL